MSAGKNGVTVTEEDSYLLEDLLTELSEQFVDHPDRQGFVLEAYRQVVDFIEAR